MRGGVSYSSSSMSQVKNAQFIPVGITQQEQPRLGTQSSRPAESLPIGQQR